ncbi:MAG TPA: hypothetical protein VFY39_06545 [Gammaproteobacteria bacterium]|nr:hypothetical protein [Gammaproteobacteria bacterium]
MASNRKRTSRRPARRAVKRGTVTDKALVKQAEKVLARVRRIRLSLAREGDPARRRETRRLLKWTRREFAWYREGLEILRNHPLAGEALEKQIQLFALIEDECRTDRPEARPI